ncbi:UDP-N-acetyl-D-glucosamine 6-dehydrogenase [compost metagenome]
MNDSKPQWVIDKVKLAVSHFLQANPEKAAREVTIACFGLAFKPDIDDLRESPAMAIAQQISGIHLGRTLAVEPNIEELPAKLVGKLQLINAEQALVEADIVVLLVDHKSFKDIQAIQFEKKEVIDSRGIWTI